MTLTLISGCLAGCGTISGCGGWEPITVSKYDKLTRETKNKILAHDEFGEKMGCWIAPKTGLNWK